MSEEDTDSKGVGAVRAWMRKRGYGTGGGDNIGFLLTELVAQVREKEQNRRTPPPVATPTREELVNLLYDYRDESKVQIADAILALLSKPT